MEELYTGYKEIHPTTEDLNEIYLHKVYTKEPLLENQYAYFAPAYPEDEKHYANRSYVCHNGLLEPVPYLTMDNAFTGKLKPRNLEQFFAFDMLQDPQTTIKLITGTFGTGKTLLLIVAALEAVEQGKFDRIIWVRNNVQVKDTDPMGALPGDSYDKLLPYLGPMVDHVGGEDGVKMLIDQGRLDVIPLAHLRGRSIKNAIILSSEAENLTKQHIQLLMGRVDEGSNLWMDADLQQRDKAVFEKSKGIETTIERLQGDPLFGYVHLIKSERSATARLADKLN